MLLMVTLLTGWIYPNPNHIEWYFIFGVGWGICDAVWQCALNALYGVLFKDHQEAAFANYRLWESVGFCAAFAYGSILNAEQKLYICVGFLIAGEIQKIVTFQDRKLLQAAKIKLFLGMIGYAMVEVFDRKSPSDEHHEGETNKAYEADLEESKDNESNTSL